MHGCTHRTNGPRITACGRVNARRLRAPTRNPRAFTLIELVTVMTVIAVIGVVVAGPTLAYLTAIRARGAAARIAADLRFTQRWAVSTRLRTWVSFDVPNDRYRLYVENAAAPGKAGRVSLPAPLDQSTGWIAVSAAPFTGATLTQVSFANTSEVEFDSWGRPYDANGAALTSASSVQIGAVQVTVQPVSGLTEVTP